MLRSCRKPRIAGAAARFLPPASPPGARRRPLQFPSARRYPPGPMRFGPDAFRRLCAARRLLQQEESGRIAVKVINHLGDEVMKVFRIG